MKKKLRMISAVMFLIAAAFVAAALSNPALGHVIYIGDYQFGPEQWRICYTVYAIVMISLFLASFFVKDRQER